MCFLPFQNIPRPAHRVRHFARVAGHDAESGADLLGQGHLAAPGTGGGTARKGPRWRWNGQQKGSPDLVGAAFCLYNSPLPPERLPPQRRVAQQQLGL